jgi:hypothetical protein
MKIRQLDGLPPIVQLLRSQNTKLIPAACQTVHNLAEDCKPFKQKNILRCLNLMNIFNSSSHLDTNQAEFCKLGIIDTLLECLAHPDFDTVKMALLALSRCLQDCKVATMPFDSLSLTLTLFNISSHPSLLSFR